jgi:DNA polymerase-3 subunit epsilon
MHYRYCHYRYDGQKIVDQFISLVNPESDITPFVQKLTSITPKMVKTAPKFHEIARRIVEITKIQLW